MSPKPTLTDTPQKSFIGISNLMKILSSRIPHWKMSSLKKKSLPTVWVGIHPQKKDCGQVKFKVDKF
jgi:hypothetical protein